MPRDQESPVTYRPVDRSDSGNDTGEGRSMTDGQVNANQANRSRESNHSKNQSEPQPQSQENPMSYPYCPPVAAFGAVAPYPFAAPYAAPYAGVPAPAGANVVVADSGHGHGTHSQLETLSDIALGGLRESAAAGRTNQLSTQIESIGDRLDTQAGFSRDLTTQKQFTDATRERGDLENRLLTAIKDESIRTREMFTENRIRELESRNADLRDARRDDQLLDVMRDIRNRLPAPKV